jgi:formamidopyrimidine-DNA glycosylase
VPELPDVVVYVERLKALALDTELERIRLASPFLLRSVDPPISEVAGKAVSEVRRLGKRIVIGLENEIYLVLHLMIAGRLRWRKSGTPIPKGNGLAAFDFAGGTLVLTEAGKKKRAALHLVRGRTALTQFDAGGLEVLESTSSEFRAALARENHTLKRALTDPRVLSGIGNAYSDEILHRARLSPFKQTGTLTDVEIERLHRAVTVTLDEWVERLRAEVREGFPEKVTAFRDEMAVHGRFGKPCPACGSPVQRIVYAANECNYCPRCQTGGKVLADRALSRLLKANWPRTLEELEEGKTASGSGAATGRKPRQ